MKEKLAAALFATTGLAALAALALPVMASELTDLGRLSGTAQSTARGVSADGSVVVGLSYGAATKAFRWTQAGGMVDIGALAGHDIAEAYGVSADGLTVVGYSASSSNVGGSQRAFLWTQAGGMTDLGTLGGMSLANGISGDGLVAVGQTGVTGSGAHAFRWTQAGGMQDLGVISTASFANSSANAANQDGSVVVGQTAIAGGDSHAFRWTQAGGMVDLGALTGGSSSTATGVSGDGAVVVGDSFVTGGAQHVFRWTEAGGLADLGTLGGLSSYGAAISADGSVVVGTSFVAGNGSTRAFRWTAASGMQTVEDWLTANGATLGNLATNSAFAANQDGSVVVGKLQNSNAFIARVTSGGNNGGNTGGNNGGNTGGDNGGNTGGNTGGNEGGNTGGNNGGNTGGGTGLITIYDIAQTLLDAARAHGVTLNALNILMNGAGSRPLDRRAADGKTLVWVGGDFGADNHGARDGETRVGEIGVGRNFGPVQLNGVIGYSGLDQNTLLGGRTESDALTAKFEAMAQLTGGDEGGLWLALTGTGVWGDLDTARAYLVNGGLTDVSLGETDIEGYGARGRLQYENLVRFVSPYAEIAYARACVDAYAETGGAFPTTFDKLCDGVTEARYGFDLTAPVGNAVRLLATLEGAHRFEERGKAVAGQVIGLGAFSLAQAAYKQDWLRAGGGFEFDVAGTTLSMMLNATTRGESASLWGALNWRLAL